MESSCLKLAWIILFIPLHIIPINKVCYPFVISDFEDYGCRILNSVGTHRPWISQPFTILFHTQECKHLISMKDDYGKYIDFKTHTQIALGFVKILQACLAKYARLKAWKPLKPSPPSLFIFQCLPLHPTNFVVIPFKTLPKSPLFSIFCLTQSS